MPDTSPSSSTERKAPLAVRQSTMRAAMTGPTPGSPSSTVAVAVLRSMGASGLPCGLLVDVSGGELRRRSGCPGHADDDLLAVDEDPGQVDRVRSAAPGDPAGLGDRVGHAGAQRQPNQPGVAPPAR